MSELHAAGVKVLLAYNPWDGGTARCAGVGNGTCAGATNCSSDSCVMTHLLRAIGADGINGDTMNNVGQGFADYEGSRGQFAIEPEDQGEYASLQWTTLGWGYYYCAWHSPCPPSLFLSFSLCWAVLISVANAFR